MENCSDLEDVETLVLHHFTVVSEQVHEELQVISFVHVSNHDSIIGTVQQNLAQELNRLTLGNI